MSRRAWVLNLDAEHELFEPAGYKGPFSAIAERPDLVPRLAGLVPDGDVILDGAGPDATGLEGRAWSPTPRALAALEDRGAKPPVAPPPQVLRRAMSRALCSEIGLTLPGAVFTADVDEALGRVEEPIPSGRWLLRRPWGFAGRGRLAVACGLAEDRARRFVERAAREGGVLVEPLVERRGDFALHAFLGKDGALIRGEPCETVVNRGGAWSASARADPDALTATERGELQASLHRVAAALRGLGYFGPLGIDAFRYAWGGETRFNPRCDVNPRYSMGWAIGMGDRRPDLG